MFFWPHTVDFHCMDKNSLLQHTSEYYKAIQVWNDKSTKAELYFFCELSL